jgi:hypothetical protein
MRQKTPNRYIKAYSEYREEVKHSLMVFQKEKTDAYSVRGKLIKAAWKKHKNTIEKAWMNCEKKLESKEGTA